MDSRETVAAEITLIAREIEECAAAMDAKPGSQSYYRLASKVGLYLPTILAALRSAGTGRAEAEERGTSGLSHAEVEAEALRYQGIAAEQGNKILRLRIAMKVLTESGHGGAIYTVRKWFAAGGAGPIPWPGGSCFEAWATEQGYSDIDGFIGFRATARALPLQTTGGARDRVREQPHHPGRWLNGDGWSYPSREAAEKGCPAGRTALHQPAREGEGNRT